MEAHVQQIKIIPHSSSVTGFARWRFTQFLLISCNSGLFVPFHSCCRPAVSLPRQPFGRAAQVQEGVGQRHEVHRRVRGHQPRQC